MSVVLFTSGLVVRVKGSRMSRFGRSCAVLATFVFLMLVGLAWSPPDAAAQEPVVGVNAPATTQPATVAQQQEGRRLGRSDWIAHVGLFCAMTLLVTVVDALFIARIFLNRRREQRRAQANPGAVPVNAGTAAVRR